jgi:6-pyruvoyltetrahydropterin/6-carboxytetrahydropterin synthase
MTSVPNLASPGLQAVQAEITLTFSFDAAHHFEDAPAGHRYGRLHGHSFEATVTVAGPLDPIMGFVVDFDDLRAAANDLRGHLDHCLLNEIPGLEKPSLENIAVWIYRFMKQRFPGLKHIDVRRPSIGEACRYSG